MANRTPQEKKRLSYLKDRRNTYGENSKSSRKNIRRNKQLPHRANRRRESTVLEAAKGAADTLAAEAVEQRLLTRRPKTWRKFPDTPLGECVEHALRTRVSRGIADEGSAAERIRRVRRRLREPQA